MFICIAIALGLNQTVFDSPGYFDKSTWILGFVHYLTNIPSEEGKDIFGIRPHTDSGIFTFLASDGKPGLQVCLNPTVADISQRNWVYIEPPPSGHLIVNLGKNLEIWSGNRFKATLHRVVLDGREERYSVPFFYETNLDLKITSLVKNEIQNVQNVQNNEKFEDCDITPADMFLERLNKNHLKSFK